MSSFYAVKREAIRILLENGVSPEDVRTAISGLDEEGILQRMRDARHMEEVVEEVGVIKNQAEVDALMYRITTGLFTDEPNLGFLIGRKGSGSLDRKG